MKKLIVANWKMNPADKKEALKLAKAYDLSGVVIAPPFVFLPLLKDILRRASLGAQDVYFEDKGAYTGEIAPSQLKALGVRYVIVGHSERRALGETDILINKKLKAVLRNGLKAILCVGEPLAVRKKGLSAAKNFVRKQLLLDLRGIKKGGKNLIVAYEPIWAVGSGRPDKPEETATMSLFIKKIVSSKLLYGGSVKAENARGFLRLAEIDGALVGGASLEASAFRKIVKIALED